MLPIHHATMALSSPSRGIILAGLIVASFLYVRGWRGVRAAFASAVPAWRSASFLLGMFLVWGALGSPLVAFDHDLLTVHMIQHLLLMTFAPALILLGEPLLVFWRELPRFGKVKLGLLFRRPFARWSAWAVSRPVFCWTVSALTLLGWHVPVLFTLGMHSEMWHSVEQASFLGAGFLFWLPVIEPWPSVSTGPQWSTLLYLFLATLPCDILSGFLVFSDRVAYPSYFSMPRHFGFSVLEDQQCAAALMWTCVTLVYLVPAAILSTRLLSPQRFCHSDLSEARASAAQNTNPQHLEAVLKMATEPIVVALDVSTVQDPRIASSRALFNYWEVTKPEINFLIAITTAAGFWMGSSAPPPHFPWMPFLHTLLGTMLVASGAATLNQLIELRYDAQMRRTARRPLASGRIAPSNALWFGAFLSVSGVAYLAISTNAFASLLAALTLSSYLFLYTPLKRITPLSTLVGAIPGAAPPLIGWAASRGHLDPAAWLLFAIVFLWQFPHFMSIAWMYREDYARAGYLVLPAGELQDGFVAWQCVLPTLGLFVVAIIPAFRGQSGIVYFAGALVVDAVFLYYSANFALQRSVASARQLLFASILYLPLLFALLALDKK